MVQPGCLRQSCVNMGRVFFEECVYTEITQIPYEMVFGSSWLHCDYLVIPYSYEDENASIEQGVYTFECKNQDYLFLKRHNVDILHCPYSNANGVDSTDPNIEANLCVPRLKEDGQYRSSFRMKQTLVDGKYYVTSIQGRFEIQSWFDPWQLYGKETTENYIRDYITPSESSGSGAIDDLWRYLKWALPNFISQTIPDPSGPLLQSVVQSAPVVQPAQQRYKRPRSVTLVISSNEQSKRKRRNLEPKWNRFRR